MLQLETDLESILDKVENLIDLHKRLRQEHNDTLKLNAELSERVESQNKLIKSLEEKNKVVKIVNAISDGDQNTKDIKLKINEYIREIDKCIALLNR